jgi:predicted trehalose synthase
MIFNALASIVKILLVPLAPVMRFAAFIARRFRGKTADEGIARLNAKIEALGEETRDLKTALCALSEKTSRLEKTNAALVQSLKANGKLAASRSAEEKQRETDIKNAPPRENTRRAAMKL